MSQEPSFTLQQLADRLSAEPVGPPDLRLARPVPAGTADPEGVTFATDGPKLAAAAQVPIGAIVVGRDAEVPEGVALLRVDSPRAAFHTVLALYDRTMQAPRGIHPAAHVDPSASVDPTASVGAFAVIEADAVIEAGAQVFAHCFVGPRSRVGAGSILFPRVTLYHDVLIGAGCRIHSGSVLGADGFGFVWNGREHQKVPQVGRVVVGDGVEIGANSCIDRATCGDTAIGAGSKMDNLVQVGHNTRLGRFVVLAGQVGISGSCQIGDGVAMGGQVGISDHVEIAPGAQFGGKSGVMAMRRVEKDAYFGMPSLPVREALRIVAAQKKLPELLKEFKALERRVDELEADK